MANTCRELLDLCLAGRKWSPELLSRALEIEEGREFLSVVVERLGDLFEPRLCDVYDTLFRQAVEQIASELVPRLRAPSVPARAPEQAPRVYVLSRITLGADVAVSSVLIDAAKIKYPEAQIYLVGPRKNYELFEADPRVAHYEAPYARSGALKDRLRASAALWFEDGIVLDPDSRLSQLGVLAVCDPSRYFWFQSRRYGGDLLARLPDLAAQWVWESLGVAGAKPYVAPLPSTEAPAGITVSLGVGGNPAKRFSDSFERELLKILAESGHSILVDKGASDEERRRVESALRPGMLTHDGPFAPFAARILTSKLFVGYDSAAGHVASVRHVPLISVASGFVSERAAARWRPLGTVLSGEPENILGRVRELISSLGPGFNKLQVS